MARAGRAVSTPSRTRVAPVTAALIVLSALLSACASSGPSSAPPASAPAAYDVIIRGGTVYDGRGGAPFVADVGLRGARIAAIGDLSEARGRSEVDASGLAVSPGFVNVLSWATESLIEDGRGMSDLLQGVTLEVFGEGWSMGPLNDDLKEVVRQRQGDIRYGVEWESLAEYPGPWCQPTRWRLDDSGLPARIDWHPDRLREANRIGSSAN